jgi:poly-gamma-glutamate capsule biosynthesis protein CapA/YwtB (metallophosphatase superfamily)
MLDIAITGDLVLDEPEADYWLSGIATTLQQADIAIGHLEVPHTTTSREQPGDVPAPGAPPENIAAIARAGFGIVSLAGNHIADCGAEGIADTIAELDRQGIAHAGAGLNISAAREPAIIECKGRRIALLSYNCVGPEFSWAAADRAGCAFLPVGTSDGSPVSPSADLESVLPNALEIIREDVTRALARFGIDGERAFRVARSSLVARDEVECGEAL